ncbi:MAG: TOTE conflict system archaeo-eukaryotic primase domain-containing protein [Christensenellales bacterium]
MNKDNIQQNIPEDYNALRSLYLLTSEENRRLKQLLAHHHISYTANCEESPPAHRLVKEATPEPKDVSSSAVKPAITAQSLTKRSPLNERIALFMSLFRGRSDVYARQWRGKNGKIGYSPACRNEWKRGVCLKPNAKCADCVHADYYSYSVDAVSGHLSGQEVLGIYLLLLDDTCYLLAIDFDEATWKRDAIAFRQTCKNSKIPCAVEISRSGNGAHVWFFFEEAIQAEHARRFASLLLTQSMRDNAQLNFRSYDRMFPNQDTLPKGGFGNLIALPFQRDAYQNGGSVFVDDDLVPYPDQWTYLSSVTRIHPSEIDEWIKQQHIPALGDLRREDGLEVSSLNSSLVKQSALAFPPLLHCIKSDRLYISANGLSQKAQNRIKRLAAFANPQFYKAQAIRMPVWNIPRVICCAEYEDNWLCLPRGCANALCDLVAVASSKIVWSDERWSGRPIDVNFCGMLREEQQSAFDALMEHEEGVLSATTAFGKTVIGAALIGARKTNTLILVHRAQLMHQWKERLSEFLQIREVLPELPKKRGRQKRRDVVGIFGGGNDTRGGIIDIALFQSMGKMDEIKPWIGKYGMVIVDECHHVPAVSFEQVMKKVSARYVYGLTATPKRQDGHHPILEMYLGPIRYHVDAKAQAARRPFAHLMIPRFTGTRFQLQIEERMPGISQLYNQIVTDDLRNHMIIDDVLNCVKEGRNCLVLSERKQHVVWLSEQLGKQLDNVITLMGSRNQRNTPCQLEALKRIPSSTPLIVCATGKYIGEGFDEPCLDTLFLTMPISWQGTLAQYVGRLHRLHEGKREVRVYDYIDTHAEMLERMYHRRLKGYAAIGYQVLADAQDMTVSGDIIYNQDSFQRPFLSDLAAARGSIVIVSPFATLRRVCWFETILSDAIKRSVSVTVCTRPSSAFQGRNQAASDAAIRKLNSIGVQVICAESIHQKFAIIDERIVWYGSVNLLSFGVSQESMMRIISGSVARALKTSMGYDLRL